MLYMAFPHPYSLIFVLFHMPRPAFLPASLPQNITTPSDSTLPPLPLRLGRKRNDLCARAYFQPLTDQLYLLLDLAALDLIQFRRNDDRLITIVTDPFIHDLIIAPGS